MSKIATPEQRKQIAELYRLYMADGLSQSESIKRLAANLGRSADGIREILKREGVELIPSRQSNKVFENKPEPNESPYPQEGEAEDPEFDAQQKRLREEAAKAGKPLKLVDYFTFDGCENLLELADELQFQEIGKFAKKVEDANYLQVGDFEDEPGVLTTTNAANPDYITLTANVPETSEDYELRKPKILLFDIETAPNTAFVWGHYEQNVLGYERQWYMLAFCAKWIDGDTISRCLPDYESYKPNTDDDREMITELWNLFNEADVIIGHNLDSFDITKSNARFIVHGLNPPSPYKTIDTKKVARRYFRFNSNKLDDLGNTLGVGRKMKHTGFELWKDCMSGDLEAWEVMRMYNRQDVLLLERVYNKLKVWMVNHPNMAILSEIENGCPVCNSTNLRRDGFSITATGRKERFQCGSCGAWAVGKHKKVTDVR
jgi:hypothetical protein